MEAYAIFEGGGAKGLAHVGALASTEKRDISFKGVAGASAGAIVAALVSCGYTSADLFSPERAEDPALVYNIDIPKLLGASPGWEAFIAAWEDLKKLPYAWSPAWSWWRFKRKHRGIVSMVKDFQGVFDARAITRHLDEKLEAGLLKNNPALRGRDGLGGSRSESQTPRVLFRHISLPLKIVATDVEERRLVIFSQHESPDFPVADAVAASISLPFVFTPQEVAITSTAGDIAHRKMRAIDGGLLSNFPAWLFDRERQVDGPHTPTFGFRLVEREPISDANPAKPLPPSAAFVVNLIRTVLSGDPLLETREIENLHEIPLTVSVSTLEFKLTPERKVTLFNEGSSSADRHFDRPGFPRDPIVASETLKHVVAAFRANLGLGAEPLIRANIVCMTTRGTLRVTYSCYMDGEGDSDDRLEFPLGSGASGAAWTKGELVICDLAKAKSDLTGWKMDKYQQALVRSDLKSLLSYPIKSSSGEVLGVLNLDSPEADMLNIFFDRRVEEFLPEAADLLAGILDPTQAKERT